MYFFVCMIFFNSGLSKLKNIFLSSKSTEAKANSVKNMIPSQKYMISFFVVVIAVVIIVILVDFVLK